MDMDVQMRDLLKGGRPNGMPKADAFIGERCRHCSCNANHCCHQRRARGLLQLSHVLDVKARNHEYMPGVELPKIDE